MSVHFPSLKSLKNYVKFSSIMVEQELGQNILG
jgi:hypothetical protein